MKWWKGRVGTYKEVNGTQSDEKGRCAGRERGNWDAGAGAGAGFEASPYLDHEESTTAVVVVVAATRAIVTILRIGRYFTFWPIKITQLHL